MRVIVSENVLEDGMNAPWDLHELLGFAIRGRHIVTFDPPQALDRCLDSFSSDIRTSYSTAVGFAARAAATLPADAATVRVETADTPRWEDPVAVLSLKQALVLLREPLAILVENADNDWSFLLGMMERTQRERVLRAVNEGWAAALHGGGDTLQRRLHARLDDPKMCLRTFVMFDSDRLHPDELLPSWTPERPPHRRAACKAYDWEQVTSARMPHRYWRLHRRFIESYMPRSELAAGADAATPTGAVDAFFQLSQEQRWYFNMKGGFDDDAGRHDRDRAKDLYTNVEASALDVLKRGFGRKLADHYTHSLLRDFDWDDDARFEASKALPRLLRLL